MQNIRPTVPRTRRIAGLGGVNCLLLLYLITATPLAPVAVALLAEMDRSHEVTLQNTAQGLQIVLKHGCLKSLAHRHGMVAQALTFFAQRPSTLQSDHVIQFSFTDVGQRTLALAIESTCDSPVLNEDGAADFLFHPPDVTFGDAAYPRPPPAASELLLTVRSTVLLI
jgi:hypothetical protein